MSVLIILKYMIQICFKQIPQPSKLITLVNWHFSLKTAGITSLGGVAVHLQIPMKLYTYYPVLIKNYYFIEAIDINQ